MNINIHIKHLKFLVFTIILHLGITNGHCQFYPVPETTIDLSIYQKKIDTMVVKPFSISKLITVNEFKEYLVSVKKDSTSKFYKSQIPTSNIISEKLVKEILLSKELQNKPMPGVSWTVAQNYCIWLSANAKKKGLDFTYELPKVSELIAYDQYYETKKTNELESWTKNAYDESMFALSEKLDYYYNTINSDPPSMKRKVCYGGSYQMDYIPNSTHNFLQYEYQDSSSRYIGFKIIKRFNEENPLIQKFENSNVTIGVDRNRLHGLYEEKYQNGRKKVIGEFSKGQRIGVWSVWDTNGVLKTQREYSGNKECEFLYPVADHAYKKLYDENPQYMMQRNKNQIYPYLRIEERAVPFSYRLWRQLTIENEPELFKKVDFEFLAKELLKKNVKWFLYGNKGNFKTPIEGEDLILLKNECSNWDFERIEIKEEFFFNIDNLLADTRQLGLSFYKNKEDKEPSYSLYYPYIRIELAKFKIEVAGMNEIINLDDFFFFNAYRGEIINHLNYNKTIELTKDQKDIYIEIERLSMEHDVWISFGR